MIITKELKTLGDFKNLNKGDIVVCEWERDSYKGKKRTRFASYEIVEHKIQYSEIILQKENNIYFNYQMFLEPEINGFSNLISIILVSQKPS